LNGRDAPLAPRAPPTADAVPAAPPSAPPPPRAPVVVAATDDALAQRLCRGNLTDPRPGGGTLFGHKPYAQLAAASLVASPPGFGGGNCAQVHRDMKGPLADLIAAAQAEDPAVGNALQGISCYRSVQRQAGLYCAPRRLSARGFAGQAHWVAPPGYSEHATGLTLDFGDRIDPGCNLEPCFADSATGRWLAANAGRFGFELSFPAGNVQGVAYEPWHYRWVGNSAARATFADR
jgi:zinc D-Ala-D-Ala carboxypeptidase